MGVIIMIGEKPPKCYGKYDKKKSECKNCPIKHSCRERSKNET